MMNMFGTYLIFIIIQTLFIIPSSGRKFDPYVDHGSTVVGIAGKGFVVLASDTRLSEGYMIHSRNISRIQEIDSNNGLAFCGSGCWSDTTALTDALKHNAFIYEWQNRKSMTVNAMSNLLSAILYSRRQLPFYSFNILGGLDSNGDGCIYKYDAIDIPLDGVMILNKVG